MANGDKEIERIGDVTGSGQEATQDAIQPSSGGIVSLIQEKQGQNVASETGGNIQPTVQDIYGSVYPDYATGYEALPIDQTIGALNDQIGAQLGATSPGALSPMTYVPGLNKPITAGGYSGKVIGSTTLFAPQGQIMPLGIVDAREKALQDAALKAAELKRIKAAEEAKARAWEIPQAPSLSNKNYQRAYNNKFNSFVNSSIEEAKKLYGDDWTRAIKDPQNALGRDFQQKLGAFQYIAERGNQVTDEIASIIDAHESGDRYVSPETLKLAKDMEMRLGNFEDADITDLYGKEKEIVSSYELDKFFNDNGMLSKEMRTIMESYKKTDGSYDYDAFTKTGQSTIDEKAREMAKVLTGPGGYYYKDPNYTEDIVYRNIKSRFGDQITKDMQTVSTSQQAQDYYKNKDMNNPILVQGTDFGTDAENVIPLDNGTETGVTYEWVDADGNKKKILGTETVTYNSIQNHTTPAPDGTLRMNPFVYVTVTSKDAYGNESTRQEALPFNDGVVKANMYKGKYKKAAELTDKVNQKWNTGSFTVAYDKDGITLNEFQSRSEDKVEKARNKTQNDTEKKGELD